MRSFLTLSLLLCHGTIASAASLVNLNIECEAYQSQMVNGQEKEVSLAHQAKSFTIYIDDSFETHQKLSMPNIYLNGYTIESEVNLSASNLADANDTLIEFDAEITIPALNVSIEDNNSANNLLSKGKNGIYARSIVTMIAPGNDKPIVLDCKLARGSN